MQIKTISCERTINLGNYENRKLQLGAEISPDEDVETAITSLTELVERKASERLDLIIDVKDLRQQIKQLKAELAELQSEKEKLTGDKPNSDEPSADDIPFDSGVPNEPKANSEDGNPENCF